MPYSLRFINMYGRAYGARRPTRFRGYRKGLQREFTKARRYIARNAYAKRYGSAKAGARFFGGTQQGLRGTGRRSGVAPKGKMGSMVTRKDAGDLSSFQQRNSMWKWMSQTGSFVLHETDGDQKGNFSFEPIINNFMKDRDMTAITSFWRWYRVESFSLWIQMGEQLLIRRPDNPPEQGAWDPAATKNTNTTLMILHDTDYHLNSGVVGWPPQTIVTWRQIPNVKELNNTNKLNFGWHTPKQFRNLWRDTRNLLPTIDGTKTVRELLKIMLVDNAPTGSPLEPIYPGPFYIYWQNQMNNDGTAKNYTDDSFMRLNLTLKIRIWVKGSQSFVPDASGNTIGQMNEITNTLSTTITIPKGESASSHVKKLFKMQH